MSINKTIKAAEDCQICAAHLPDGVRPVFVVHPQAKILIIGQAPGRVVHKSGVPWADASGKRLREWMGVTEEQFYDPSIFAILPMGFCFPGSGKNGDLPPRPECAPAWHEVLINMMPEIKLTLLFGKYAQDAYLGKNKKSNLTKTVQNWEAYAPQYLPLPHPSPRNNIWLRKNEWFEKDVIPYLQKVVGQNIHFKE